MPWVVLGLVVLAALPTLGSGEVPTEPDPIALIAGVGLVAAALTGRIVLTLSVAPRRRPALLALMVGLLMWMTGSLTLAASGASTPVPFPAPGEVLFIGAYAAFAAFIFMDGQSSRGLRSVAAWSDAVILVGGMSAVAALVILGPLARLGTGSDLALMVAFIYPLISLGLVGVIVGQWALGMRPWDRRSLGLAGAFGVLALADVSLYLAMPGGGYSFSTLSDALWGAGLVLLVQSACAPRRPFAGSGTRHVSPVLLVGGVVASVLLLVTRPDGPLGTVIAIGAGLVMIAAAVRVGMSLASAQQGLMPSGLPAVDHITGLPSRAALSDKLDADLARGGSVGLLVLQVLHIDEITEAFGPVAGDEILREVGEAVSDRLPAGAYVARFGDAIAVVVLTEDEVVLRELAHVLRSAVPSTLHVDGVRVTIRLVVGVATGPAGDGHADGLLAAAASAAHEAVNEPDRVGVFGQRALPRPRRRLQMASDLRTAVRAGRIDAWYQPMVLSATGSVDRWEVLARWNHPREGMVPPTLFLALARREGLMHELSMQVAARAAADLSEWRRAGVSASISMNMAPPELLAGVLLPDILHIWADHDLAPQDLTIELTEDSFHEDPESARAVLLEARRSGVRLSIDHYGAGFSSLSYLRDLPIGELKLDRGYFASVCTDSRSAVIVQSTVTMAHALGLSVVAEGIETEEVAARAIVLGVDRLQGYYLAPPMPAAAVPMFARDRQLRVPGA